MSPTPRELLYLGLFLTICFAAAALGGLATASSVKTWYPTLVKPAWTPPSWLFGPVWTALYAMMAIAGWLVWKKAGFPGARVALSLFALQLGLNTAWSICFFGLKNTLAGFVDVLLLWAAIAATMVAFGRVVPLAGWLLSPYLLWVTYAAALNGAILRLNRGIE